MRDRERDRALLDERMRTLKDVMDKTNKEREFEKNYRRIKKKPLPQIPDPHRKENEEALKGIEFEKGNYDHWVLANDIIRSMNGEIRPVEVRNGCYTNTSYIEGQIMREFYDIERPISKKHLDVIYQKALEFKKTDTFPDSYYENIKETRRQEADASWAKYFEEVAKAKSNKAEGHAETTHKVFRK